MKVVSAAAVLACLCAGALHADFSYQQKAEITGGALAGMMKFAGAFSKQAREPMVSHIYVKGHRIAHVNPHNAQITDLDKETITSVNFDHKTYSVMTFEQMKQQFEQMSKQMEEKKTDKDVNMNMNVSAKNTGQTREIDGLTAKELVMTMTVQGSDLKTGQTGSMDIRSDMWMAKVPGYDEVRDVYKLMGEKLGFVTGGSFLPMQRPDMVKNMGEMYKEMGKLEGMPVETVVAMGGSGTPGSSSAPAASPASANSSDSAKSQAGSDEAVAAAMSQLGGLAGKFGGFGRKKKKSDDNAQPAQTQQTAATPTENAPSGTPGSLMEMTTRSSDFSTAAVDDSRFAVPDGFKQVEPDSNRRGR